MSEDEEEVDFEPEDFVIGAKKYSITTVAYLPIHILSRNQEKGKEISGQKLWCGSLCIIQYFLNNSSFLEDSTVYELGAGTGVLGMVCKSLGASTVVVTDHDEVSLRHMRIDSESNSVDIKVSHLNWFQPTDVINEFKRTLLCQSPQRLIIVAGDVLYKAAFLDPFFNTLVLLLQTTIGSTVDPLAILCHVPRAGVTQAMVVDAAEMRGLHIAAIDRSEWTRDQQDTSGGLATSCLRYCPSEDVEKAQVYRITLCD